jgi:hypothetical protein
MQLATLISVLFDAYMCCDFCVDIARQSDIVPWILACSVLGVRLSTCYFLFAAAINLYNLQTEYSA